MNDKFKKLLPGLALACLIAFHVVNNIIWLNIDASFLKLDSWREWSYSLRVFDFLRSMAHFPHFTSVSTIAPLSWHGIFTGFIIAPFYFIFGPGQDTAVIINSAIFLSILILSVYALARKISGGDQRAGLFAAFLVSFYPLIFNHGRLFMLDLPLTAMFSAGLYFLIASERFRDKKNSFAFGICLGLGLLTKFNFILFIAGPLALSLYLGLREKKHQVKTAAKNIRLLVLAALSLSALFYLSRFGDILQRARGLTCADIMRAYRISFPEFIALKISWLIGSLEALISDGMSFILFLAFILAVYPFRASKTKNKAELSLAIVIPLFTYIFILILDPRSILRYSLPIFPVAAVITAIGLLCSRSGRICAGIISAAALLQFFAVSYGIPGLPQKTGFRINLGKPCAFNLVLFKQNLEINPYRQDKSSHPSRSDWKAGHIFDIIKKDNPSGKHIKILMLSSPPEIYEAISAMTALTQERVSMLTVDMVEPFYVKRFAPLGDLCLAADYLLILDPKTAPQPGQPKTEWEEKIKKAQEVFYQNIGKFKLLERVRLPDNTSLLVYKNAAYPGSIGSRSAQNGELKAVFDSGSCRIFYKELEITQGLGLFSAVLSQQSWRDSREAVWEVNKESDSRLIASGRWMFIPVKQLWVIDVFPDRIIWQIKLAGEDNVSIEAVDCKLMFSDRYKELSASTGIKKTLDFSYADEPCKRVWAGNGQDTMTFAPAPADIPSLPGITLSAGPLPADSISVAELSLLPYERAITAGFHKSNELGKRGFPAGRSQDFRIELRFERD